MSPVSCPILLERVWKRYRLGTQHDSLRDAVAGWLAPWAGHNGHDRRTGEFWALRDVTFEVRAGETLGLIGANGAGKSTILKILSRITRQTRGAVAIRGRFAALIELGGGFHPDLTGAENIYLQGTMLGIRRRALQRLFDSIVAFSELASFLETPVKRYSSGMVVRLGFAIAAHVQPDVLLLDEVLAVGDLAFQQKCFARIAALKQDGTTMIFISHNLEAVQQLCDRALLLREGQVVAQGTPEAMVQRYRQEVVARALAEPMTQPLPDRGGEVRIRHVQLQDADGREVGVWETGRPLRIEIGYEALRPIRHAEFRVSLERLDGLLCHATSSRAAGLMPLELSGRGAITLAYPALNLLPNCYQVAVEVFEAQNPIPLASVRHQRFFQVTSDDHEQGAVHLEHRWEVA